MGWADVSRCKLLKVPRACLCFCLFGFLFIFVWFLFVLCTCVSVKGLGWTVMGKSDWSYGDEFVISCCLDCVIKIFACDCHIIFLTLELFPLYPSEVSLVTERIGIDHTTVTTHGFPVLILLFYVLLRLLSFYPPKCDKTIPRYRNVFMVYNFISL